MEKPLCLIAYAKSLRKNNLAWFISAFACGFARLRAPAKHRRNAFAAKVGTALLTKSLHPRPKRNVAQMEGPGRYLPHQEIWRAQMRIHSTMWPRKAIVICHIVNLIGAIYIYIHTSVIDICIYIYTYICHRHMYIYINIYIYVYIIISMCKYICVYTIISRCIDNNQYVYIQ